MKQAGFRTLLVLCSTLVAGCLVSLVIAPVTVVGAQTYAGVATQPLSFGSAQIYGQVSIASKAPFVGMATTPDGKGYWLVAADGGVFAYGDAGFYGSMGGRVLAAGVVGMAATPDGKGYWLVAADGGVFAFGDAAFYGSMGGRFLAAPVVGIAPFPNGNGYWLVGDDGGVFAFGGAPFLGSGVAALPAISITDVAVGMAATPDGKGYWLVANDGSVLPYGDAGSYGSMAGTILNAEVVGMTATPDGKGYWLVGADGGVFAFGDARFFGSLGSQHVFSPVAAIIPTPSGAGYWVLTSTPIPPPGVPVLGRPAQYGPYFWPDGFGLVAPSGFSFGTGNSTVSGIKWNSWGTAEAVGTGLAGYVAPGEFSYQATLQTATVVASDLGNCGGQLMYQTVEWYFPEYGGSFNPSRSLNVCTGG